MKTKLFGIGLMLIGITCLGWISLQILIVKGMLALIYGIIPLIAGFLIFNYASKAESPGQEPEKESTMDGVKTGFGRIRSFLKGLL